MTTWRSRFPFPVDPLIAEAKRRMRRRRLLIAAMLLVLAVGAFGAADALTGESSAHPTLTPASSGQPPLSGLAARAAWCGDAYNASGRGGCHSPDGKWAIVVDNEGRGCTLTVARLGTGRHDRIGQPGRGGCAPDLWIGDRFVIQEGIYGSHGRVVSLAPPSRRVKVLARFSSFIVSPDRRWIAGQAGSGEPFGARVVAVISLAGHTCRVVAEAKSPDQNVSVDKSPWSMRPALASGPYTDPVFWRTVVQGGRKVRIVSGPGTGFTRNSRSLIVAEWQNSPSPPPYAIHKRLVKFNLSSLHTPCDGRQLALILG
jgi:hypothetical protein